MLYRKRPVVIEAVKYLGGGEFSETPEWLKDALARKTVEHIPDAGGIYINTLEGTMRANPDDYLILGVHGEIYACKPDIFAKTYEKVERV